MSLKKLYKKLEAATMRYDKEKCRYFNKRSKLFAKIKNCK